MIEIGKHNDLIALRETTVGFFMGDQEGNDVLLPNKYVPEGFREGDSLEVFVYRDSEDRPVATTLVPKIFLNSFAVLKCVAVDRVGAFFDWGMEKDLLVPFKEQNKNVRENHWYLIYMYLDETTDRLVATTRWANFCQNETCSLSKYDPVKLLVAERTDLGYNVVIDNMYKGLLYENEIFQNIKTGDRLNGYVKIIRPDKKIDVSLQESGHGNVTSGAKEILEYLEDNNGFMELTDKSDPEDIKVALKMSKKTFKRALGALYKEKKVLLNPKGVELIR